MNISNRSHQRVCYINPNVPERLKHTQTKSFKKTTMAPSQILSSFLSTSILLLLFISPSTCYSSLPNYKVATNHQPADDQKVNLSLYYETLCPGCQDFIIGANGLIRLFKEDGLLSIVNLRLVPWGNAKLTQNDEIVCQVSLFFIFNLSEMFYKSLLRIL